ncbi:MAG: hypothetical protein M1514_00075 [Patescibacteria group bacterium]|nr:hypothetical protein [Patescibacteria group bacterium]
MVNFNLVNRSPVEADQNLSLPKVFISDDIITETEALLLSYTKAKENHEGLVYWAARNKNDNFEVIKAIAPRAVTTAVSFRVNSLDNAQIITELNKDELVLIAQLHTHPFGSQLIHSLTEEEIGFMPFEGMFSIIVPDYGQEGILPLEENGIFIFHNGDFQRLSLQQVQSLFKIK